MSWNDESGIIALKFNEYDVMLKWFSKASEFLVKCQVSEPFVVEGLLKGVVSPWEFSKGKPILEDFHDTLEASWVWTFYTMISDDKRFLNNIGLAWLYVVSNWDRFIDKNAIYDCTHVMFAGSLYEKAFKITKYRKLMDHCASIVADHIENRDNADGREYSDPWWAAAILAWYGKHVANPRFLGIAKRFVNKFLVDSEVKFTRFEDEPKHIGPGNHDFFSTNANKAIALIASYGDSELSRRLLLDNFLPIIPEGFISRHVDENAWNANVATAMALAYRVTRNEKFRNIYVAILNELSNRDISNEAALPRHPGFPVKESWVTFFWALAQAALSIFWPYT